MVKNEPSEGDLFQVARLLVTPVSVNFLSEKLGIPISTIYRWLDKMKKLDSIKISHPIIEGRNSLYWLRGYADGQPSGTVAIPKSPMWLHLYLRLGWEYHDQTQDHYILRQGRASSEPDEDVIPADFRIFRDYTLIAACDMRESDEEYCSNFFRIVCSRCKHQPYQAPMLREFCPQCAKRGSYELAKHRLQNLGIHAIQSYVLTYLSYEYRKELMLLMEKLLRELYEKNNLASFYRLLAAFNSRYDKLKRRLHDCGSYDSSLEEYLLRYFPHLVTVSQKDAHKAISVTLNCARWHQMDISSPDALVAIQFDVAAKEYEETARPIIDEALRKKLR